MSNSSHHQILRSTTIIGGSSAISIIFRILASKVVALIIGPSGVGLLGLFNAATGLAGTVAGMGLANSSGVRRIAEAGDDDSGAARTIIILKRLALIFGGFGSLLFFILRVPISRLTFGTDIYARALGLLSIIVFLTVVSGMQSAFLRGMRRVGDIARVSVLGVALGTLLGLPAIYLYKQSGVASYLLIFAGATLFVSWWYVRRIKLPKVSVSWHETYVEARGMMGLGVAFMLSGLVTLAATYLVKVLVTRQMGLNVAGLYEASSALANVYVGFILGAMGTDFFPHLTAVSHDNAKSSQLMNVQVEVGLLVASPGILLVFALGPLLLHALYSAEFLPAFDILRWQVLGTFLRVISWPLGYIILAKGKGDWFFWSELVTNLVYIGCIGVGIKLIGVAGIGAAFFVMYVFHTVLMIALARRLSDFKLGERSRSLMMISFPVMLLAFGVSLWNSSIISMLINLALTLIVGAYSLRSLYMLVGPAEVQIYIQRFRNMIGWKGI
jgi:antigen flippase